MGRARCEMTFTDAAGNVLGGATVNVYQPGTTTAITETIYQDYTGVDTLSNPLTADANGKVRFYLDAPKRVDLKATKTGYTDITVEDVPVETDPGDVLRSKTNANRVIQNGSVNDTISSGETFEGGAVTFPTAFTTLDGVWVTITSDNFAQPGEFPVSATVFGVSVSGFQYSVDPDAAVGADRAFTLYWMALGTI